MFCSFRWERERMPSFHAEWKRLRTYNTSVVNSRSETCGEQLVAPGVVCSSITVRAHTEREKGQDLRPCPGVEPQLWPLTDIFF